MKSFIKDHKTGVVTFLIGTGSFLGGWVARHLLGKAILSKAVDEYPKAWVSLLEVYDKEYKNKDDSKES